MALYSRYGPRHTARHSVFFTQRLFNSNSFAWSAALAESCALLSAVVVIFVRILIMIIRPFAPWIFLGGLQARVRDSFSPETAFGLQYRRRGSCHTPVPVWRARTSGRRSTGVERVTAQCHLHAVSLSPPLSLSLFIPAILKTFSVSAKTASITLLTVSPSWNACTQHHVRPGELNWTHTCSFIRWKVDRPQPQQWQC